MQRTHNVFHSNNLLKHSKLADLNHIYCSKCVQGSHVCSLCIAILKVLNSVPFKNKLHQGHQFHLRITLVGTDRPETGRVTGKCELGDIFHMFVVTIFRKNFQLLYSIFSSLKGKFYTFQQAMYNVMLLGIFIAKFIIDNVVCSTL